MRRSRRAAWLLLVVLVAACAGFGFRQQQQRFDGEHGLAVYVRGDSLHVYWLTAQPDAGRLDVVHAASEPEIIATVATLAGTVHRASLPLPPATKVLLRYGGTVAAPRHETAVSLDRPARDPVSVPAADSLYIVGDTHGMYDELIRGLRGAGLIDTAGRWSGGRKHLVFAGDLTDRGPDVLRLVWLVYRLEHEAAEAGGRVHVVLGNHEIMVMLGDLRYVHPKELHIAALHGVPYHRLFDVRTSVLGRWLASKPALLRVGRVLIAHGGATAQHALQSLQQIDDTLATYMHDDVFYLWPDTTVVLPIDSIGFQRRTDFFWDANSIFWHRGYIQTDTLAAELTRVLDAFGADVFVLGHTAMPQIQSRYDGRIIAAHTPRHGAELVLLVRTATGYDRFRVGTADGPIPF